MRRASLLLRIRVIRVSTRAAVRSLKSDDPQSSEVLERGRVLLDRLEQSVLDDESDEVRQAFAQACEELESPGGGV
ncbi:MAG: hypothetical protein QOI85_2296 [Chloroflexota bacterium]|jgi:hypothetical protein|nr:hypothetical protein [Chloroflexota bacterium]